MLHFSLFSILLSTVFADSTLKLVNLLYRHGDRSPITVYDSDPNQLDKWRGGPGWLQTIGMEQHYTLGGWLRKRYIDSGFLNKDYDNKELKVYSSDVSRCLMSAYCNLAGMYPPGPDHQFDDTLKWQPIPVHTRPTYEDNTLSLQETCPRYLRLYSESFFRPKILQSEQDNKDFYAWLAKHTGVQESLLNIWEISDTLVCEMAHNFTIAPWVNNTVFDKLQSLTNQQVALRFSSTEMRRLKGGPLLKEVIGNIQNKIQDDNQTLKMYVYSAHDTTVAAFLSALDVYNGISPPYAAMVMMELHQNISGDYFVKLFFKNSTVDSDSVQELAIPKCDHECPLQMFLDLTKPVIPVDWLKECGLTEHPMSSPNPNSGGAVTLHTVPPTSPTPMNNSNGMACFSCNDVTHLKYCDFIKRCQQDEQCAVAQASSSRLTLNQQNPCFQCCNTDYCNKAGCGDQGFQGGSSRGPLCLDCPHVGKIEECDAVRLCSSNQACRIEEFLWGENERLFKLGCEDKVACAVGTNVITKRSPPLCSTCCDTDFCNTNCTSSYSPAFIG